MGDASTLALAPGLGLKLEQNCCTPQGQNGSFGGGGGMKPEGAREISGWEGTCSLFPLLHASLPTSGPSSPNPVRLGAATASPWLGWGWANSVLWSRAVVEGKEGGWAGIGNKGWGRRREGGRD